MKKRPLGNTGLELTELAFGASSLGSEFRRIDLNEAIKSVHVALDRGINLIDTSPYYGRGVLNRYSVSPSKASPVTNTTFAQN